MFTALQNEFSVYLILAPKSVIKYFMTDTEAFISDTKGLSVWKSSALFSVTPNDRNKFN